VAWGLPVLSLLAGGSERTVELRVQEIRFLHASRGRRDRGRCVGYTMIFGTWYDPGGRICVGERGPANRGGTLEMEGWGNGLATRISLVTGVAGAKAGDSGR
jgi:hypothetical protein